MTTSRQTNPSGARLGVLLAVHDERERQEARWNPAGVPGAFPPDARLPVLVEEVGEVADAMQALAVADPMEGEDVAGREHLRAELVQVAAVAVRWIEALDVEADDDA